MKNLRVGMLVKYNPDHFPGNIGPAGSTPLSPDMIMTVTEIYINHQGETHLMARWRNFSGGGPVSNFLKFEKEFAIFDGERATAND